MNKPKVLQNRENVVHRTIILNVNKVTNIHVTDVSKLQIDEQSTQKQTSNKAIKSDISDASKSKKIVLHNKSITHKSTYSINMSTDSIHDNSTVTEIKQLLEELGYSETGSEESKTISTVTKSSKKCDEEQKMIPHITEERNESENEETKIVLTITKSPEGCNEETKIIRSTINSPEECNEEIKMIQPIIKSSEECNKSGIEEQKIIPPIITLLEICNKREKELHDGIKSNAAKKNLKPNTKDSYEKIIIRLEKVKIVFDEKLLYDDFIIQAIKSKKNGYVAPQTLKNILSAVNYIYKKRGIKNEELLNRIKVTKQNMKWVLHDTIDMDELTDDQLKHFVTWGTVLNVYKAIGMTTKLTPRNLRDYVILSLYVLIPTRRLSDYFDMYVTESYENEDKSINYFVNTSEPKLIINEYKTSGTYGTYEVKLEGELLTILRTYVEKTSIKKGMKLLNFKESISTMTERINGIFNQFSQLEKKM